MFEKWAGQCTMGSVRQERQVGIQRGAGAISCRAIYTDEGLDFGLIAVEKHWRIFNKE